MQPVYVYPGSFSPPTYGHFYIVAQAAAIFPTVHIVCSTNARKTNWFSESECVELWRAYQLPANVQVHTFSQFVNDYPNTKDIVMIRGARNETDLDDEKKVLMLNWTKFGIDKFFYIMSSPELCSVSSSHARAAAQNLDLQTLAHNVAPMVVSALLEKVLKARNVFMVVGQPGSGKSTFLRMLSECDCRNVHVNTDEFNHELRPYLESMFPGQDLVDVAAHDEVALKAAIAKPWFELLAQALRSAPADSNVFVEIPYGLQADKLMFRFVGGKVIYVGCDNPQENERRVVERGTPKLVAFIDRIPGWEETDAIARQYGLQLTRIQTGGDIEHTAQAAQKFAQEVAHETYIGK